MKRILILLPVFLCLAALADEIVNVVPPKALPETGTPPRNAPVLNVAPPEDPPGKTGQTVPSEKSDGKTTAVLSAKSDGKTPVQVEKRPDNGKKGTAPAKILSRESDAIAASVNGSPISVRDIVEETARQEDIIYRTLPRAEHYQAILNLRNKTLDNAINRKLLLLEYEAQTFRVPNQYVENIMDEIALSQGIRSRREFYARLRSQHTSPAGLRQKVLEQLIVQAMTARRIQLKGTISPREVRKYFDDHAAEFGKSEQWELGMIALPPDSPVYRADGGLQKFLTALRKDPGSFSALAALYSNGPNADSGGSLGLLPKTALRPEFAAACKNAKAGDILGPIHADGVDYFLQVLNIVPPEKADFLAREPALRKRLENEHREKIMAEYYRELRSKAIIRIYW